MARTWLAQIREKLGHTHQEIADKSNIERAYYTQIELGNRNPSVTVAKRIAATMKFNWTIFFDENCSEKLQKDRKPKPSPPAA